MLCSAKPIEGVVIFGGMRIYAGFSTRVPIVGGLGAETRLEGLEITVALAGGDGLRESPSRFGPGKSFGEKRCVWGPALPRI